MTQVSSVTTGGRPAHPGRSTPPPSVEAAFGPEAADLLAARIKAVADPTRLRLLATLLHMPDGVACVHDLAEALETAQPTVSHHLKTLSDAGFLDCAKRGPRSWYSVRPERTDVVRDLVG
ncbi:transcriptional regulator [Nocardiopsis gilva YIM 90087]|uniref:Transcriptional regulator n=1 Tax=Nocardiopsis gilva YIM 90087 TaxID=1235441 RepID=A0A223S554_9ACTN|nr:metalloregulator ArsR/SmtB family transcription factor [Nocardiopsis gilva]ASU83241.1 transcriptional regulator [Nocardiopsis gilva YIM 90087]